MIVLVWILGVWIMGLVFLGIILFFVSFLLSGVDKATGDHVKLGPWQWAVRFTAVFLIVVGFFVGSIVIVPAGYRGVLKQFGAVRGVLSEGIHIIIPYINDVEQIEVRTQKEVTDANASSRDLQIVTTSIALNFHIDPAQVGRLYRMVGPSYKERIIDPAMQESIKMVTAKYTAEELIKSRAAVKSAADNEITQRLKAYDIIVEPTGLSITNFNFSNEFNAAIEAKQVAQQEAEKQKYVLQQAELERQTAITRARGVSEAAKLNALALQAQGGSKVLAREWIEKWDGHLPTVAGGGGYIIDLKSLMQSKGP